MIKLGVLGSTNGTDLQAILDAIDQKIIKFNNGIHEYNNKLNNNVDLKKRNTKNTSMKD